VGIEMLYALRPNLRELIEERARALPGPRYCDLRVEVGEGKGAAAKEEERRAKEYDKIVAEATAGTSREKQQSKPNRRSSQSRSTSPDQSQSSRSGQGQRGGANQSKKPAPTSSQPALTSSQQQAAQAVRQSVIGARPATVARPAPSQRRPQGQENKVLKVSRAVIASAVRYALALHAAAAVGLVVYALVQGGAPNVVPTLGDTCYAEHRQAG
jgi:DNA mismatch repair ATPase MutL